MNQAIEKISTPVASHTCAAGILRCYAIVVKVKQVVFVKQKIYENVSKKEKFIVEVANDTGKIVECPLKSKALKCATQLSLIAVLLPTT